MQPATYISQVTGLSIAQWASKVSLVQVGDAVEIAYWSPDLQVKEPSVDDLAAALAAPEPAIDLAGYAAAARYAKETGGITINGVPIATDENSQAKITAAYVRAKEDASYTTKWKGADGSWTALDATMLIAVGDAVFAHVDGCFATEEDADGKIKDGSITTTDEIDALFAAAKA